MPRLPRSATMVSAYFVTTAMTTAMWPRPRDGRGCCARLPNSIASFFSRSRMRPGWYSSVAQQIPRFWRQDRRVRRSAVLPAPALSPQRAFEACVGEGIEYLSQFVRAEDAIEFGLLADYRDAYDPDTGRFISAALAFCLCRFRPVDCMDCRSTGDRWRVGAVPACTLLSAASLAPDCHAP